MARSKDWIVGLLIAGSTLILIIGLVFYNYSKQDYHDGVNVSSYGEKIAVVELNGVIYDSRSMVRQFKAYGDNRSVKAILFRINSPGGGVAASQEIYEAVKRVRDQGTPVIASMSTVAASGGYYVACGADTIIANPGTTTGSIGVIAEMMDISEMLGKIGIKYNVIKSGRYKGTGSIHKPMTPAERQYLQSWIDDAHDQFVSVVADERRLPKSKVVKLADGRVFTGRQALENGLVDILGDYDDALDLAAELGGIQGDPTVVKERLRRPSVFDLLFDEMTHLVSSRGSMQFQYIMK